jgi:hypothetical protein
MPIDMRRPLIAAIQAALDEVQNEPPTKKHRGAGAGKALLIGAGLYTAGRVAVRARGGGMMDAIQQRLPDLGGSDDDQDDGDDVDDEEFDDEEPEAEGDDDLDEESEDEPEPEPEDEAEPEPEDEAEPEPEGDADEEPQAEAEDDEEAPDEDADGASASTGKRSRGRSTRSRR